MNYYGKRIFLGLRLTTERESANANELMHPYGKQQVPKSFR